MSENIKVICRVRPLNSNENSIKSKSVLGFPPATDNVVTLQGKQYTFDKVLEQNTSQSTVYEVVAKQIVVDVLNGYNGTIFAYGQTASGKTFTMEGFMDDPIYHGIIPRIINDIFDHIYSMDENIEFHIKVTYFEIYLEKIRDLLDVSKTNLSVHEDKNRVPYVKGATERFVSSPEELVSAIEEGKANRHIAVTNMNEHSSRSHSVFMIQVTQENIETHKKLLGKLYLVDLAGSEKVGKSGAEGTVLDEAKNINKSLLALGNVINALVEDNSHVPYRDSKLTRILQESLGGNARTTMVICCSPAEMNEAETKSTLQFGSRAKTIKNCVTVNEELTADEWRRRYEKEKLRNKELKIIITKLELELKNWRAGNNVNHNDWVTKSQYNQIAQEAKDMASNTDLSIYASTDSLRNNFLEVPPLKLRRDATGGNLSVNELYRMLDDKDDEINKQDQIIEQCKQQIEEQDKIISSLRENKDQSEIVINRLESENELSKQEVTDVIQALEELISNFEQTRQEVCNKNREIEATQGKLNQQIQANKNKDIELHQQKESNMSQKKKFTEMFNNLIKDLIDVGECLSDELNNLPLVNADRLDDDYCVTRLYTSKMKTEVKITQSYVKQLLDEQQSGHLAIKKIEEESRNLKLKVQEYETRIGTLTFNIDESEIKKRQFEEKIDELSAEISRYKANEQLLILSGPQNTADISADIKSKLDDELKRQTDQHSSQIKELRDLINKKQRMAEEMRDQISRLTLENEKLTTEYEAVVAEVKTKTEALDAMTKLTVKKELARQDLKSLEETVMKELETLQNMRRSFLTDLTNRMTKATNLDSGIISDEDDYDVNNRSSNRQKIKYMEVHLEELTNNYKQVVRENTELRSQLPMTEKRLKINIERVKMLENALKHAKDESVKDRIRYQTEVDKIKEVVRQRNVAFRGTASKIAKPIRAGHAPSQRQAVGRVSITGNSQM